MALCHGLRSPPELAIRAHHLNLTVEKWRGGANAIRFNYAPSKNDNVVTKFSIA